MLSEVTLRWTLKVPLFTVNTNPFPSISWQIFMRSTPLKTQTTITSDWIRHTCFSCISQLIHTFPWITTFTKLWVLNKVFLDPMVVNLFVRLQKLFLRNVPKQGVLQSSVLTPSLFLLHINSHLSFTPNYIHFNANDCTLPETIQYTGISGSK